MEENSEARMAKLDLVGANRHRDSVDRGKCSALRRAQRREGPLSQGGLAKKAQRQEESQERKIELKHQ
jgi:hypothetical protein